MSEITTMFNHVILEITSIYYPVTAMPCVLFLDEYLTDFSSKEAMEREGWVFDWDDQYVFSPGAQFCKDVLSTSYCGFSSAGDGMISYTFSYSGTATLQYGQSWDTGSVHIKKNDEEIDSRTTRGSSNVIFDFSSGDVLKILELDVSVINIDKLTLEKRGKKKGL